MADKTFTNKHIVEVPEELYPLEGSITVPIILTPAQFDEFWKTVNTEEEDDGHHAVLSTYKTRLSLILNADLKIDGQPLLLTSDPMDLPDQAVAPFIIAATQECVSRATRLPILPKLSKTGATA